MTTAEQMAQARKVSFDALTAFYEASKRLGTAQMESAAAALAYSRALKAEAAVATMASRGNLLPTATNPRTRSIAP